MISVSKRKFQTASFVCGFCHLSFTARYWKGYKPQYCSSKHAGKGLAMNRELSNKFGIQRKDFKTVQDYDRIYKKRHREENAGKHNAYMRSYNATNREVLSVKRVCRMYNITPQEYSELWNRQKGLCAICSEVEVVKLNGVVKKLAVDHCHLTKKVRGLLCQRCNQAIGLLRHDPFLLEKAKSYLKK